MSDCSFASFEIRGAGVSTAVGLVYPATRRSDDRPARVFTLDPDSRAFKSAASEFQRRQRVADMMGKHPSGWSMAESGAYEGVPYFALVGSAGRSLRDRLDRGFPDPGAGTPPSLVPPVVRLSPWLVRNWVGEVAGVVEFLHQQGVVVGNLNPANIWITDEGAAMLTDPGTGGVAEWRSVDRNASGYEIQSRAGDYLAPEQVLGWAVGPDADIYSLGAILYELLGGKFPGARARDAARIGRYLPPPSITYGPDPALGAICKRALSIKPSGRYRSAEIFRAAILAQPGSLEEAHGNAQHAGRSTLIHGLPEPEGPPMEDVSSTRRHRIGKWLGWK